ncbi:Impact family protein [Dioscorea alata]|uniref:Impact family protein n=1 Tax=Dioscorea alata TaxID=55571 RepID=A0ACB7VY64_DIOAL|nr:Impact family protein [Dioscorea alata]
MAVRIPPHLSTSRALLGALAMARSSATQSIASDSGGGSSRRTPSPYTTLRERVSCEREIKRSKFIAIASPVHDERSAQSFLLEVQDPRATHNCWAYKLGDQFRCNDDGEPSGTAGKPIYSAIVSSGIDMVMVVVIRHFGGIKLGTGGLVRAYGGVALDCLKSAETRFVKPKAPVGIEVPYDLLGTIYHQCTLVCVLSVICHRALFLLRLQLFQAEDIKQDYDTGKDDITMVTFRLDYDKIDSLENAINSSCGRKFDFYKQ